MPEHSTSDPSVTKPKRGLKGGAKKQGRTHILYFVVPFCITMNSDSKSQVWNALQSWIERRVSVMDLTVSMCSTLAPAKKQAWHDALQTANLWNADARLWNGHPITMETGS